MVTPMKIVKQTPTTLTIKSNKRRKLLIFGVAIFGLGLLLTTILASTQPLTQSDLQLSKIFYYQQESADSFNPESQNISVEAISFKLTYYVGRLMFTRERPVLVLALLGFVVGFLILIGPIRSQVVKFDKSQQQVELKQPRWFFRSHLEIHPFQKISGVRVEREQASTKSEHNFGVNLVISHSEGLPLSKNYVHYKTVFPVGQSYRYDYERAKTIVEQINSFLAKA